MNNVSHRFTSNPKRDAPAWLQEQVYGPKRQHTVELVRASIEALRKERQRVSLASVVAKSKQIDPKGIGISQTAILHNDEARAYYEQQRTWRAPHTLRRVEEGAPVLPSPPRIAADRDLARVRRRYLRLNKAELVERLLTVEQAFAEHEERWLGLNDELLTWQLRAQQAEKHLNVETVPLAADRHSE